MRARRPDRADRSASALPCRRHDDARAAPRPRIARQRVNEVHGTLRAPALARGDCNALRRLSNFEYRPGGRNPISTRGTRHAAFDPRLSAARALRDRADRVRQRAGRSAPGRDQRVLRAPRHQSRDLGPAADPRRRLGDRCDRDRGRSERHGSTLRRRRRRLQPLVQGQGAPAEHRGSERRAARAAGARRVRLATRPRDRAGEPRDRAAGRGLIGRRRTRAGAIRPR